MKLCCAPAERQLPLMLVADYRAPADPGGYRARAPMDRIFITGLAVDTIIGIYDWERVTPQRVVLDLEIGTDISVAAASESVDDTLNYKTLRDTLANFVGGSEFQLIETLAEAIARIVLDDFNAPWVRLTLHKPTALGQGTDVGLIIERGSFG